MKINSQLSHEIDNKDDVVLRPEDIQVNSNINMPFSGILQGQVNLNDQNQEESDILADFNYDSLLMDIKDAEFFINLAQDGQFSLSTAENENFGQLIQLKIAQTEVTQKSAVVTNKLVELIEKAHSTQKPVRISFDNDVSVILKIDKNGKITAEFIPGSMEVENYLRNNIALLKQKFDNQNLPYNDLFYRQNSRQDRRKNKNRGE